MDLAAELDTSGQFTAKAGWLVVLCVATYSCLANVISVFVLSWS